MRDRIELDGIVLSSTAVGDYDKRLVILTSKRGKITAFARGARKPNSPYLGISEPFNYGTFTLSQGYDAYHLAGADVKEYFLDVKNDIEGICYGTYFCDVLEYLCVDGMTDIDILNLLYVSLKALGNANINNRLVRRIFELRALTIDGVGMVAFNCAMCDTKDVAAFYLKANGLVCKACAAKYQTKCYLSESAIYTIQYVISAPLNKLYTFEVSPSVFEELDEVIADYFNKHVTKKFNSLEILTSLS